jgi:hypothetical protein
MQVRRLALVLLTLSSLALTWAQAPTVSLRGQVTDPSGAVVTQAKVTLTSSAGATKSALSNSRGEYEVTGLVPGNYAVNASAQGFSSFSQSDLAIHAGSHLNIVLELPVAQEQVQVQDENTQVAVTPSENASSIVVKGADLDALSDDPDELQSELEALAGPGAGPNGGQIYIDGFTGGQLPPKSSIREIRINQNPFSSEYDTLGYGRIEVLTKPGTGQLHGQFSFNDNNSIFSSKNPLIPGDLQPGYQSGMYTGTLSGPLTNKASFFLNVERRNIENTAIVDASNDVPTALGLAQQGVASPQTRTNISPRLDYQLTQNNTVTVRYQFTQNDQSNQGIGGLNLASQAYNVNNREQTLQISDTQVVNPKIVNETRFQYVRDRDNSNALNAAPSVDVQGLFQAGGNSIGQSMLHQDHYELQNYTSIAQGNHMFKVGGRLRTVHDADFSTAGFNGTYTFTGLCEYDAEGCPTQSTAPQPSSPLPSSPLPSQFKIVQGNPAAKLTMLDAGLFAQDDWRLRPNMTLSYGLRFETQNHIEDHADLAPRLSYAWGLGHSKTPKTVLRSGFGIFYTRFADSNLLNAEQVNGINQQEFVVTDPQFFSTLPPSIAAVSGAQPTMYQVDPHLHAPYVVQTAVSLERQVTKAVMVSATYLNSRGFDQLLLRNTNAPLPGTYILAPYGAVQGTSTCGNTEGCVLSPGIRPLGGDANIYQYESEGIFRQNQLITNFRVSAGTKLSLWGYYALSYADSDVGGSGGGLSQYGGGGAGAAALGFPSNQYNLMADYGRASFDIHDRVMVGGTFALPYAFRLSPFVLYNSGAPFNITLPEDTTGDGIYNDRPAFCSSGETDCVQTAYGDLSLAPPSPGASLIPINYGNSPGLFTMNLRLAKTFGFGKKLESTASSGTSGSGGGGGFGRGGGGRGGAMGGLGARGLGGMGGGPMGGSGAAPVSQRYSVTFSIFARNLTNRENLGTPIGVLPSTVLSPTGSPTEFDFRSVALAGGPFGTTNASRRVDLQVLFSF